MSNSFVTPRIVACQAPLSMDFSRQEYWSGLPFPSPRDLPDPGIEPTSPTLAGRFFTSEPPEKLNLKLSQSKNFDGKGGKNKTYFLTHRADPHYAKTTEKEVCKNEEQSISTSIGKVFSLLHSIFYIYTIMVFYGFSKRE